IPATTRPRPACRPRGQAAAPRQGLAGLLLVRLLGRPLPQLLVGPRQEPVGGVWIALRYGGQDLGDLALEARVTAAQVTGQQRGVSPREVAGRRASGNNVPWSSSHAAGCPDRFWRLTRSRSATRFGPTLQRCYHRTLTVHPQPVPAGPVPMLLQLQAP